jgi:hypothetical protein
MRLLNDPKDESMRQDHATRLSSRMKKVEKMKAVNAGMSVDLTR